MEVKHVQEPEFTFLALWKIFICITSVISILYYWELENIVPNIIAFRWQTDSLNSCSIFQIKKMSNDNLGTTNCIFTIKCFHQSSSSLG